MSRRDKRAQRQLRGTRWQTPTAPRSPRQQELCVYCGIRPASDREHVFARCLFDDPKPNPTITVPACNECNAKRGDGGPRDMTLDEEYMRQTLCSIEGADRHPVASKLLDGPVKTCFDRSPRLASSFRRTMKPVMALNPNGLLLPATSFNPDWSRIHRVIRKMTRGLFFTYMKRRLPSDAVVQVSPRLTPPSFMSLANSINGAEHVGPVTIRETIGFAGARNSADEDETCWLMNFYNIFAVAVWTLSRQRAMFDTFRFTPRRGWRQF